MYNTFDIILSRDECTAHTHTGLYRFLPGLCVFDTSAWNRSSKVSADCHSMYNNEPVGWRGSPIDKSEKRWVIFHLVKHFRRTDRLMNRIFKNWMNWDGANLYLCQWNIKMNLLTYFAERLTTSRFSLGRNKFQGNTAESLIHFLNHYRRSKKQRVSKQVLQIFYKTI